jgi:hypothetical protein
MLVEKMVSTNPATLFEKLLLCVSCEQWTFIERNMEPVKSLSLCLHFFVLKSANSFASLRLCGEKIRNHSSVPRALCSVKVKK